MNLLNLFAESVSSSSSASSSSSSSSGSGTAALKALAKNPVLYIVLGAIVLLIIVVWLIRRVHKASDNHAFVVTKGGKIVAIIGKDQGEVASKFVVPFAENVAMTIQKKNNVLSNDGLLINDGPDKLYRINYSLGYDVTDVKAFYEASKSGDFVQKVMVESLRKYAYEGNADKLLRSYVEEEANIVALLNKAYEGKGMNVTSFKIGSIAPVSASAK